MMMHDPTRLTDGISHRAIRSLLCAAASVSFRRVPHRWVEGTPGCVGACWICRLAKQLRAGRC